MQNSAAPWPTSAWDLAEEATGLVERYPHLQSAEVERLVAIYPRLPMLHLALMASDEKLAPRLEAFQKKHRRRIRTPFRQYAAFLIPILLLAIIIVWTVIN